MPFQSGVRLGSYEIVAPIGAGGMGEIYRAHDTKLDRDVAIKALPGHLAANPGALARFEREAKAIASLSHPNIVAIFDFGTEGATAYSVTELLDGSTLREKIGTVPPRKAIEYAVQIVRGLAAAHGHGIAHRDLKPENVFVTKDGRVKILDFGLARQAFAFAGADLTASPTLERHTEPGTVLGTVGYMSPEQVRGEAGDHRSDIFSFGAVLYELVSGRRAFQRQTPAETMTAILKEDPPSLVEGAGADVPPGLARVILHCLEKNPAERFQSASDVAFALEALSGLSSSAHTAVNTAPRKSRAALIGLLAIATIAGVAIAFAIGRSTAAPARPVSFLPLTYRPQAIFRALFAPDGKTIVFSAARSADNVELFSLSPDYPEPRSLGLQAAQLLSVSSRSELAILTNAQFRLHRLFVGTLARMPLGGGAPREILEGVREADWSPDGATLAITRVVNGRDRLEFPIGKVLYETSGYVSDLRVSPDGNRVAFFEHPVRFDDRGGVAVVDVSGRKTTLSDGYGALEGLAWSPDGREVLFSGGLSYARFTVRAATLSGQLREALESAGGLTLYDISRDGRWLAARDDINRTMRVKAPGAREDADLSWLERSKPATLSSDGRTLLFTEESGVVGNNYAVALRKTDGSPVVRLGEGTAIDLSPDGKWALAVVPGARDQVFFYPTGAGESRRLDSGPIDHFELSLRGKWFPDNNRVLMCGNEPGHANRCYVLDGRGGPPRAVTPENTQHGFLSPDGNRVFVSSTGPSPGSVVLQIYPLAVGSPQTVTGLDLNDRVVTWSRDGRSLLVARLGSAARLERFDIASRRRESVRLLAPPDMTGALRTANIAVADDVNVYAYSVDRQLSTLFLIQGAR